MNKKLFFIIITILSVIFIVSTGTLIRNYCDSKTQTELYTGLIETVEKENKEIEPLIYEDNTSFLEDYQELYVQNNDMVGWIKIEDTKINYPVVQSKYKPDYYLNHNFNKQYSVYGCPYVQESCDVEKASDNTIIHGHHMNDGTMFAELLNYQEQSFYKEHKTITYDSLTEHREYEIIAVFKTVAYLEEGFKYYHFVDAKSEEEFDEYINRCKELSLYDIAETANYGDELITLSTCEYSRMNGRFVLVAKLNKEGEDIYE